MSISLEISRLYELREEAELAMYEAEAIWREARRRYDVARRAGDVVRIRHERYLLRAADVRFGQAESRAFQAHNDLRVLINRCTR